MVVVGELNGDEDESAAAAMEKIRCKTTQHSGSNHRKRDFTDPESAADRKALVPNVTPSQKDRSPACTRGWEHGDGAASSR